MCSSGSSVCVDIVLCVVVDLVVLAASAEVSDEFLYSVYR